MNEDRIYDSAIRLWGIESQLDMAQEECAEFIQARSKLRRAEAHDGDLRNQLHVDECVHRLADECADVIIMMGQVRRILGGEIVDMYVAGKLERISQRIDMERARRAATDPATPAGTPPGTGAAVPG